MVYLKHDTYIGDTPFWSETLDMKAWSITQYVRMSKHALLMLWWGGWWEIMTHFVVFCPPDAALEPVGLGETKELEVEEVVGEVEGEVEEDTKPYFIL